MIAMIMRCEERCLFTYIHMYREHVNTTIWYKYVECGSNSNSMHYMFGTFHITSCARHHRFCSIRWSEPREGADTGADTGADDFCCFCLCWPPPPPPPSPPLLFRLFFLLEASSSRRFREPEDEEADSFFGVLVAEEEEPYEPEVAPGAAEKAMKSSAGSCFFLLVLDLPPPVVSNIRPDEDIFLSRLARKLKVDLPPSFCFSPDFLRELTSSVLRGLPAEAAAEAAAVTLCTSCLGERVAPGSLREGRWQLRQRYTCHITAEKSITRSYQIKIEYNRDREFRVRGNLGYPTQESP
jgi:hypothetical protein